MNSEGSAICIVVVDRVRLIAEVIMAALEEETDIYISGIATTKEEALTLLEDEEVQCDVLLVSTNLPDNDSLELVKEAGENHRGMSILMVGLPETEPVILHYIEAGAAGYVLKEDSVAELLTNVRAAYNGEAIVSPEIAMSLMSRVTELAEEMTDFDISYYSELTNREKEVLDLVAEGLTNKEIADRLYIELGTVKNHVHRILDKLNVANREEAAAYLSLVRRQKEASSAVEEAESS